MCVNYLRKLENVAETNIGKSKWVFRWTCWCYSYVKNEYKIKIGNSYNYIDLLLFNYIYNAFVVVELKVTELKKEHIGQTLVYMNYIDEHIKSVNQNKTIGIIFVKVYDEFVMNYYKEGRMISRKYELI